MRFATRNWTLLLLLSRELRRRAADPGIHHTRRPRAGPVAVPYTRRMLNQVVSVIGSLLILGAYFALPQRILP